MGNELLFLRPLVLTVMLECNGAYALGIRKPRELFLVVLVNAVTNPLLHVCAGLAGRVLSGTMLQILIYGLLEPLVILFEGWVYSKASEMPHPFRVSFILNMTSIAGGILWNCSFHFLQI